MSHWGPLWTTAEETIAWAYYERTGNAERASVAAAAELPRRRPRGIENKIYEIRARKANDQYREETAVATAPRERCECGAGLLVGRDPQAGQYRYCLMCGRDYYGRG